MPFADAALIAGLMIALGACSAFFSAMETALFSLQPRQIARLRERLPTRGADIDALVGNPRRVLSMILLADTLMNLPLCVLSLYFLHAYCAWHGRAGLSYAAASDHLPFWPSALLLFFLIVGVCDLLPKLLALQRAERMARPALNALHYMRPLLDPVCAGLQAASEWLARRLTPRQVSTPLKLTPAEFAALVEVAAEEGALQGAESEMIQEILKMGEKTAKDCMTPRVEAFAINDSLTNEEAADLLRAERRHRVPVYAETPDDIVGILDARRFLTSLETASAPAAAENNLPHFTEMMDPPSYVSETMRALDLLRSFLTHAQGMAVIVDEYGGTEGIVTMADIIEEIVGDALPSGEDDLYIEELEHGRLLAGGHARLDDISEHLGFELEAEGLDTINGWIFNRLGYLPPAGSVLRLAPLKLTVRRVTRKTVAEVLVEKDNEAGGLIREATPSQRSGSVPAVELPDRSVA